MLNPFCLRMRVSTIVLMLVLTPFAGASLLAQDDVEQKEEEAVAAAVAKIDASVLQIETIGGVDRVGGAAASVGPTTALVVGEDGYLLSSSFNFAHQPASIFVKLPGGQRAACQIVARDRSRNLALLKVDTDQKLSVPQWVSRDQLRVGGWAIAVGRVFDNDSTNISTGIISATNRIWGKAIQTDAKISPNNFGGPLINIDGKVIGILTPLSTRGEGETAGVDWYDSGIGFAVPVSEVMQRFDDLKKGDDLFAGKIGVSFEGRNIYADPAKVATLVGSSPAAKAGIRAGDTIVEFGGKNIHRQSELRHAIGPYYAGDSVKVGVERDGKRIEFSVTLARKIDPYVQPYLGLLLEPPSAQSATTVRHVFADSPAAKSGVQKGDTLQKINGSSVADRQSIQKILWDIKIGSKINLKFSRGGNDVPLELTVEKMNAAIPKNLSPLGLENESPEVVTGIVEVKVPEEPNLCHALVPEKSFSSDPALLVWIAKPGELDFEAYSKRWHSVCNQRNIILLVPQSADKTKWVPDDAEFIQKAVDQLKLNYSIDDNRVAIGGSASGGSMASVTAFAHRELFRGLIMSNASIPGRVGRISTDPVNPLQVMVIALGGLDADKTGKATIKKLEAAKIPCIHEPFNAAQLFEMVATWVDGLDRL